jgi:hypothetical protein
MYASPNGGLGTCIWSPDKLFSPGGFINVSIASLPVYPTHRKNWYSEFEYSDNSSLDETGDKQR